jgi:cell division transport system permease protein
MRVNFVLSEVWTGLRRNITMTIAMILTTAVSLGLMGAGLIIAKEINQTKDLYYDKIEVSIFLVDDITAAQKSAIETKLKESPEVQTFQYESKDQAYERFKELFKDNPSLVNNTPSSYIPASFRVKLKDPEHYPIIAKEFPNHTAGVDTTQDDADTLNKLFTLLNGVRNATIAVAIVQALAALLLISNTIQLAAYTRRRETSIMRLVGASRWYTQLPFILEAAIAGLIGAILAVAGLGLAKRFFVPSTLGNAIKSGILRPITWNEIFSVSPILAATAVVLAGLAAYLTLRLYVRD